MNRHIVRSHELDFDSAGRRDYLVALPHDSIWGDHLVPLTVIVGPAAEPGRGLVAIGSTHGNEYEGPVAIRHTLEEIETTAVRGRIILVPVLNVAAFRASARDSILDDNVNLNRAFVDGAGTTPILGKITHRIAEFIRKAIWPHVHVVIDLHAGGDVARFELGPSFHPIAEPEQNRMVESTARWFGAPIVIVYQNETPGLLTSDAEQLGKITIGAEMGWGSAINPDGVRYARHGIRAAAINSGQMVGEIAPIGHHRDGTQKKVAMVDRSCFIVAPFDGHFEPLFAPGVEVKAGDTIGYIHNFQRLDLKPWPVHSGASGVLVAQAWNARILQGQHIGVVGNIQPWAE